MNDGSNVMTIGVVAHVGSSIDVGDLSTGSVGLGACALNDGGSVSLITRARNDGDVILTVGQW
jgi:hypothetical protein